MSNDIRGQEALHHHHHQAARAQELCESRGGRPGLPVPNKPTVSVDVKQHSVNQPGCHSVLNDNSVGGIRASGKGSDGPAQISDSHRELMTFLVPLIIQKSTLCNSHSGRERERKATLYNQLVPIIYTYSLQSLREN